MAVLPSNHPGPLYEVAHLRLGLQRAWQIQPKPTLQIQGSHLGHNCVCRAQHERKNSLVRKLSRRNDLLMVAAKRPDIVKAVIFGDANIRSTNVHETMVNYHS